MSETVTTVLGVFALATLVLVQSRQVMREIARTAEEWRRMKQALRGRGKHGESEVEPDRANRDRTEHPAPMRVGRAGSQGLGRRARQSGSVVVSRLTTTADSTPRPARHLAVMLVASAVTRRCGAGVTGAGSPRRSTLPGGRAKLVSGTHGA